MTNQEPKLRLDQRVVKTAANFAKHLAEDSVENRCFLLLHQPKEPENLAARLKSL